VFGQNVVWNVTEHNPAPSPSGHPLLSGGPPTLTDIHQIFTFAGPWILGLTPPSSAVSPPPPTLLAPSWYRKRTMRHTIRAAALVLALCPARCAPDLERLAFHFGTDKSHDDHKYTDLYAMLFAALRNTAQNITEIGIASGQSLWLWNDYFSQAHIWGIDIAPNQLRVQRPAFTANAPRVHLLLGDVTNPSEVGSFGFSPESMDVIIDDGPHSSGPNERILVSMWPYLKPGGYYCVEDVQTGIDDMAATQSTASGVGVPGKPGWAYLAHGAAEGRMGEQARQILQEHGAGPTLSLNL
jgi:hypothetical protein